MSVVRNRYVFKFYYIGSKKFYGSQRQPDFLTVEECLINALKTKKYIMDSKNSGFEVASRTDKMVSARGASFSIITDKEPILMEINSVLPKEIGLWGFTRVPIDFSSRFDAISRHYKYIYPINISYINNSEPLDLDLMKLACRELEGKHDFMNFSKREKDNGNTVRDIESVLINLENDFILFDFKSKAFLRQQIRRMVAKLIEVGTKKVSFKEFLKLFDPSSYFSYQPADPISLILWDIHYDDKINFIIDQKSIERMFNYFFSQEKMLNLKRLLFSVLQHHDIG